MEYTVGQQAFFSKTISESDVLQFAEISGDFNPLHIDPVKAGQSRFGKRVVHGALINAMVSTVLGMKLPGEGTIYLSQTSRFLKPVFIGDTVTAKVEFLEIDGRKARLATTVMNQNEEKVLDGEALVLLP